MMNAIKTLLSRNEKSPLEQKLKPLWQMSDKELDEDIKRLYQELKNESQKDTVCKRVLPGMPPPGIPPLITCSGKSSRKKWKLKKIFRKVAAWTNLNKLKRRRGKEGDQKKPNRRPGREEMRNGKTRRRPGREEMRGDKTKRRPRKGAVKDPRKLNFAHKYVHNPQPGLTYCEASDKSTFGKANHCGEGVSVMELNASNNLRCFGKSAASEESCAKKVVANGYETSNAVEFVNIPGCVGTQISVLEFQVLKKAGEKRADGAVMMNQLQEENSPGAGVQ